MSMETTTPDYTQVAAAVKPIPKIPSVQHLCGYTVVPNVLTPEECRVIIDEMRCRQVRRGAVIGDKNKKGIKDLLKLPVRRSDVAWLDTKNPDWFWLRYKVFKALSLVNAQLFQFEVSHPESFQLTRYHKFDWYAPHFDSGSANMGRKLTVVINLNNPKDYVLGGTWILGDGLGSHIHCAKQQGSAIIFPSYLYHAAIPVLAGVRHSLVCWFHGHQRLR